jgi:hypothetical protein
MKNSYKVNQFADSLAAGLLLLVLTTHHSWSADKVLNEQFNKEMDFDHYYQLDIADLDKLPRPKSIRKRQQWWPSEFEPIQKWENIGVKFVGYLHGSEYVQEFWTTPEVYSLLVFFGDYPHASDKRKILRCYIPDPDKHPTWTDRALNSISKYNNQVVIYGRLIWDNYLTKDWVLVLQRIQVEQNNVMVDL